MVINVQHGANEKFLVVLSLLYLAIDLVYFNFIKVQFISIWQVNLCICKLPLVLDWLLLLTAETLNYIYW